MTKKRPHSLQQFFGSRVFLLGAFIVATIFALGFARAYYQDFKVKQEIARLEAEVSGLEKKKIESLEILKYVQSGAYVEDRARTELNMKKPGERVLFLNGSEGKKDEGNTQDAETRQFISNPVKWWYYFTHTSLSSESE